MSYSSGLDAIVGAEPLTLVPRNGAGRSLADAEAAVARQRALHGLAGIAGAILGGLLWRRHWIIASLLGWGLGDRLATLITGRDVWAEAMAAAQPGQKMLGG